MKITIDTKVIKEKGIDLDAMLYLISLYAESPITSNTFEKVRQRRLLEFEESPKPCIFDTKVKLSEAGIFDTESLIASSIGGKSNTDERFTNLAKKLRELFPAGKKPGTSYTWRDSVSCISDRLKKFFVKYDPEYKHTDEEIINATKEYVSSFNGNYKYMQLLRYFIWKNKTTVDSSCVNGAIVGEVERQSQLAAYLENNMKEKHNDDWDLELR